jgi:chromosome segregation ATPase
VKLKAYLLHIIRLNDEKYEQRFRAQEESYKQRLDALEKSIVVSFAAAQRAEDKADAAQMRKNESLNEMRGMAEDFNKNAMPRAEAMVQFDRMKERLDRNEKDISDVSARGAGLKAGWGWAAAVVALALAVAAFVSRSGGAGG